jgi:hypothetical protein
MHRIVLTATFIAALASSSFAATAPAASKTTTTIGGGVKNPWTTPYTLAIVTVPEPASVGILGLGAAALLTRRRTNRGHRR